MEPVESKSQSLGQDSQTISVNSIRLKENLKGFHNCVKEIFTLIEKDEDLSEVTAEIYDLKMPQLKELVTELLHMHGELADIHLNGDTQNFTTPIKTQHADSSISTSPQVTQMVTPNTEKFMTPVGFDVTFSSSGGGFHISRRECLESSSDSRNKHLNSLVKETNVDDPDVLLKKISVLEEDLLSLQEKIQNLSEENSNLKCDLHEKESNLQSDEPVLLKKISVLEEDMLSLQEKLQNLSEENSNLKRDLHEKESDLQSDDPDVLLKKISVLEEDMLSLQEKIQNLSEENSNLKRDLHEKESDLQSDDPGVLLKKISVLEEDMLSLQEEIQNLSEENSNLKRDLHEKESDLQSEKTNLEDEKAKMVELQNQVSDLKLAISDSTRKLETTEKVLEGSRKQVSKLYDEIARMAGKLVEQNRLLSEFGSTGEKLASLHKNSEEQKAVYRKMEEKVALQVSVRDDEIKNLKAKNNRLKTELIEKGWLVEDLNHKHDLVMSEKDGVKAQLDTVRAEMCSLQTDHERVVLSFDGEKNVANDLKVKVGELEKEVDRQREVMSDRAEEKREAIRQLSSSVEHYRSEYKQLREAFVKQCAVSSSRFYIPYISDAIFLKKFGDLNRESQRLV